MNENRQHRSFFFPILLITGGVLFLLSNMGYIQESGLDFILRLWPLIFIIGGLDDLLKGESVSGPVLGIGIGSLLLLTNLGYFQWSVWELLFRFWPVFLIAWGMDLIIGRRTAAQKIIGALVAIGIVGGMFWMAGVQPNFGAAMNTTEIAQNAAGVKTAKIEIERPVGGIRITSGSSNNYLIYGTVPADGFEKIETDYSLTGSKGIYQLNSRGEAKGPVVISTRQTGWNLAVNPQIPLNLTVNTAVGESRIDLEKSKIEELNVKMAVGRTEIRLPKGENITGNISGAVGEIILYVPRGASVRINANTAVTAVTFPGDFRRENNSIYLPSPDSSTNGINLKVDLPVGIFSIRYLP